MRKSKFTGIQIMDAVKRVEAALMAVDVNLRQLRIHWSNLHD